MTFTRIRIGRDPFVKPGKITHRWSVPIPDEPPLPHGNEFDADPINPLNWAGGHIFKYVRGSKKCVWACRMYLPEGFTITVKGKKIRGNPGNWLIIDGTEHYILSQRMFKKKFYKDE